jgi:RNA polymerase sigma factor (sigma-70 family)
MGWMGGNGAASAEIEAIYRERFRAFLFSVTAFLGDGEAALDVVQDGFALALRRRDSYRREGSLEAWLWRIVLNTARDRFRSRRREAVLPHLDTTEDTRQPDEHVRRSLLALPERQKLAVFLRYYADLSYEQIAETLGVSAGTVAASLNAAHATLRRDLAEEVVK